MIRELPRAALLLPLISLWLVCSEPACSADELPATPSRVSSYGRASLATAGETDLGMSWSTIIGGGSDFERVNAAAVDYNGFVYLAGTTSSPDLPVTSGVVNPVFGGGYSDAFVAKLDPSGALVYCTYLGGSGAFTSDAACGIAVDSSGCAYVAGFTNSSDFPTTLGAFDPTYEDRWGCGGHAFVCKLSADGSALVYSTFLGGSNGWEGDRAYAVAVDSAGCAYVVGSTDSSDFPITPGVFDSVLGSYNRDGFISKLNASGSSLAYSTYLGGQKGSDCTYSVVVDSSGCAYVGGETCSLDFPTTVGAFSRSLHGPRDGFVAKVSPTGAALAYSTFLGGMDDDSVNGVDVDASGCVYAAGLTDSDDFPTTSQGYDTGHNGDDDAFVIKLDAVGSTLLYSTFLGGDDDDSAVGIAVNASGCAYVAGTTDSSDFPATPGAYDTSHNGGKDAFMAQLSSDGSGLIYVTFLGGGLDDEASGIAAQPAGPVYIVGQADSLDFPSIRQILSFPRGGRDLFAVQLGTSPILVVGDAGGGSTDPPSGNYPCPGGAVIPLSANPYEGFVFDHWEGGVQDPDSQSTSVTVDVSKYVAPVFVASSDSIGGIIRLPDGVWVVIPYKPVTGIFDGGFYMEELDRSAAVKVVWPERPPGTYVAVYGCVGTVGIEKVVFGSIVVPAGYMPIPPVYMPNRSMGGHIGAPVRLGFADPAGVGSLYNLGLLVRTTGRVMYLDPDEAFAYIDDGSGLSDGNALGASGSDVPGVRVEMPSEGQMPPVGNSVGLTGVSSWRLSGVGAARLLRLRSQEDVTLLSGGMITGRIVHTDYESVPDNVESLHPYTGNCNNTWTITAPSGVHRIRLHFTEIELEADFDFLYLKDAAGTTIRTYSWGTPLYDVWSEWVEGNTITLSISTDASANFYGFQVDRYEVETVTSIPGVTVQMTPEPQTTQTGSDGRYTFSGLSGGTYTIIPSQSGFTFTPSTRTVDAADGEYVPNIDFERN